MAKPATINFTINSVTPDLYSLIAGNDVGIGGGSRPLGNSLPTFHAPRGSITYGGPRKSEFQQRSTTDGKAFEAKVREQLRRNGWTIHTARPQKYLGVEIDIIASPPGGPECLIECKGGNGASNGGIARSDSLKKAVGTAWVLQLEQRQLPDRPKPYLLVTSMMPGPKTQSYKIVEHALRHRLFDHVGVIEDILRWGMIYDSWYNRYGAPILAKIDPKNFIHVNSPLPPAVPGLV